MWARRVTVPRDTLCAFFFATHNTTTNFNRPNASVMPASSPPSRRSMAVESSALRRGSVHISATTSTTAPAASIGNVLRLV